MYVCEFCGREFPSAGGINGHRNAHLIRNEFGHRIGLPCEVCEEITYYQMQGIPYHPDCFAQQWSGDEEYEAEWKRPRKAKKKSGVKLLPSSLTTGLSEMTQMISGKTTEKNADTDRWRGACILPDGSCHHMDFAACNSFGGKFQSPQTTCNNTHRWVDADLAQDFREDHWYRNYQAEDRPEEERMTRATADNLVAQILEWLDPFTDFAEVCGSYRRGREDPGDLDVVVILKSRVSLPEITELWVAEGKASAVNWVGEKKTQMVIEGVKVDIRTSTPRALGAALLYFTGPSGYNIGIRSAAKRAGFKLNEYGLFNRETGEYIAGATEEDIYAALGRNYRPPTERRAEENKSFEATAVYRGKIPDGAVGRAMLNQKLMDEAEMLEAIQKLENAVRLGMISEEEIMKGLQEKFGAESFGAEVQMSRYSDKGWSLWGRKLYKYGRLQGSIRGNISTSTKKPMKENNPEETYTGRHHVIWTNKPDNTLFNQVSQKIKPESFEEWMDVIYETNRQLNHKHEGPPQWQGKAENTQDFAVQESGVHHAEEFANEGLENPMRSAIIRGLRTAARDGYVVAAPPYGNRSAGFYNNLAEIILEELGEIGTEDLGPEVSGTGRAIDPYRVVADLASGRSVEIESPDEVSDYSVGIADMVTSFTQQSTIMDRNDGFIPPEGYTRMQFDLPYTGMITRRLGWPIAHAMGIYATANNKITLYSTPQKNRNSIMIINMLLEELQPEVSSMTDGEKEQYYQEFGQEIKRQVGYYDGSLQVEKNANQEWAENNYGVAPLILDITVSESIQEKARADATRLNPFNAETQDFAAQEWGSWIRLATQCSCGRTVEPYEYKLDENNKGVDVKYKCDCGGGICSARHYGNIYSTPCRNKAEYMGLCSHHATCERCKMSLKEDYEYFGRNEGHDEGFCYNCYDDTGRYGAETQDFADRFEIQIRTSRGNTTERIPVGRPMLVRRLREILSRQRLPYAIDVFGTEAAFNVMGPYGMQVYRPRPKLLATYKYGRFESGEMADHLNEKLGL